MHVDSLKPEGIKGIPIPAGDGGGPPAPLLTSAFADDVCIFLESVRQLTRFKELLHIYCIGAGALNSWEKTVGLRVGDERESDDLPTGWTEGIDINTHPTLKLGSHTISGIIRYLGIFLGAPDAVAEAWVARTSERISDRTAQWCASGRPPLHNPALADRLDQGTTEFTPDRLYWNLKDGTEMLYGIPVRVLSVASWFHWSGMLLVSYYDHSGCKNATGRYPMPHT